MNSFDSAFEKVCRLVNDFKENESHYLSPKYNEQQARKDYIDRLFIALGWDVNHTEQRNPYRQEVKVEETQINQRRPDYTFYIEPKFKEPKFFVEAKKPSRNLKDPMFYYQTIRYARFSSTPVAVLTDFEEFHILDCRFKPDINTVLKNPNHLCFNYNDYTVKEKFEKIYFLFAREEVAKNSLGEYSDSLPKLKIKGVQPAALKLQQQTIDEEFLEYLDGVREKLAKAFKKNDLNLTSDELTEATQRTIDRLVFIRFLEDKLIEDDDYVSKLGLSKNSWTDFISLCKALNAKYNGIVFKEHFIDSQKFSGPELSGFADICLDFSQRNPNGYNYNLIPIHILGSIYERFLGKVVVATDKRVRIDEKPEVRKAGGVYYTPKYIVDYIVDNTVGKILRNESGDCHSGEGRNPSKGKTPKEISKLRFADIACGSGSFLIGVFETLLEYHNNYYWNHHDEAKSDGCLFKDGAPVLSIRQKQNILLNNIYGVDIDHQAVEVTQLSLALKMLEDETLATANEMQVLFHEKILPDLTKNIVCGNSLIGTDILEGKMFPSAEERKLNPMDFEKRFSEIMKSGGFDAIVGNPPWVSLSGKFRNDILNIDAINYLIKKYEGNTYMPNIYEYFVRKGLMNIKLNGLLSLIVPDRLGFNNQFINLRKHIIDNFIIEELIYKAQFPNIITDTLIFRVRKGIMDNYNFNIGEFGNKLMTVSKVDILNDREYKFSYSANNISDHIIKKLFNNDFTKPLSAVIDSTSGFGGKSDKITKDRINEKQIAVLKGRCIERYFTKEIYYFEFNRQNITGRTTDINKLGASEKVLLRKTGLNIIATYDNTSIYPEQSLYFLFNNKSSMSLRYITGIINSKLFQFIYMNKLVTNRDSTPQLKKVDLDIFPLRAINFQIDVEKQLHDNIVLLVNQILDAKKQLHNAKTEKDKTYYERKCADLDNAIDAEVYKLYGLTEEEIKIVEGKE
ncbi:MAG: Eco57I restriction-modification methylase domain-containing protein [Ignavibacteria bacterium]